MQILSQLAVSAMHLTREFASLSLPHAAAGAERKGRGRVKVQAVANLQFVAFIKFILLDVEVALPRLMISANKYNNCI